MVVKAWQSNVPVQLPPVLLNAPALHEHTRDEGPVIVHVDKAPQNPLLMEQSEGPAMSTHAVPLRYLVFGQTHALVLGAVNTHVAPLEVSHPPVHP